MSYSWKTFLFVLSLFAVVVWFSVFSSSDKLKIVTCDVGQGDATLIIHKSFEVLIDGGPDGSVIDCLSSHVPFWDRTLEVVILTHPQRDHFTGLIDVFERYKVKKFLANPLNTGSPEHRLLISEVLDEGCVVINPVRGMSIRSHLIQLDILHPSEEFLAKNSTSLSTSVDLVNANVPGVKSTHTPGTDGHFVEERSQVGLGETTTPESNQIAIKQFNHFSGVLGAFDSSLDPNDFSTVILLSFDRFKFLFTGDAETEILDDLATTLIESGNMSINYIKIPHHGSKNSISEKMYELVENGWNKNCLALNMSGVKVENTPGMLKSNANVPGVKIFHTLRTNNHSGEVPSASRETTPESLSQYTIYNIQDTGCYPPLAVISVGRNSYGHPHEEVIKRLSDKAIKILRTDMQGDIVVVTDGKKVWVEK